MGKYAKEKVPELYAAKRALISYIKDNNIDPSDTKRIKADPELNRLVFKLNKERDKVMFNYPALDRSNNIKLLRMAKEEKKAKKAKKVVKETKPSTKKGRVATKYDYPQVKDEKTGKMRDMNKDEKKRYRVEQRKKLNSKSPSSPKGTEDKSKSKSKEKAIVKDSKKKTSKKSSKGQKKEED